MNPEHVHEVPESRTHWCSGVQWGAIIAGAMGGFGTLIILGALGAAIGITAGAAVADEPVDPGKTAVGFGIGAGIWALIGAIAVGLVGGWVYSVSTRRDLADRPCVFGALTWCAGVILALLVASFGAGGLLGILGGSAAGMAAQTADTRSLSPDARTRVARDGMDRDFGRLENGTAQRALTPEEEARMKQAAEDAAKTASAMSWTMLGALLLGLAATMLGASVFNRHRDVRKPETRIRPSPVGVS